MSISLKINPTSFSLAGLSRGVEVGSAAEQASGRQVRGRVGVLLPGLEDLALHGAVD